MWKEKLCLFPHAALEPGFTGGCWKNNTFSVTLFVVKKEIRQVHHSVPSCSSQLELLHVSYFAYADDKTSWTKPL